MTHQPVILWTPIYFWNQGQHNRHMAKRQSRMWGTGTETPAPRPPNRVMLRFSLSIGELTWKGVQQSQGRSKEGYSP